MILLVSLILIGSARSASFEDDHIVTSYVKQLLVIQKERLFLILESKQKICLHTV